jgi:multiple sugar transport system ATP-binding protein
MSDVVLEMVTKIYPPGTLAVEELSIHVAAGELVVLVGPSGCGKTTTLRLIAGLESPTSGIIRLDGQVAKQLRPDQRNVGMLFQRPALFPNRTVRDNLGIGLSLRQGVRWWSGWTTAGQQAELTRQERVLEAARLLGLETVLDRYPAQLSGGQQHRVALGRTLVRQPGLLLFDEPLSNLDLNLRIELRRELHLLQRSLRATMIWVTHDPLEAMALGDRVGVLERGRLRQIGKPEQLVRQPANRFVAGFFGWPPMNIIEGRLQGRGDALCLTTCLGFQEVCPSKKGPWAAGIGRAIQIGISPEDVFLLSPTTSRGWPMRIRLIEQIGKGRLVVATAGRVEISAWCKEDCQNGLAIDRMAIGSQVMVQLNFENACLFDAASGEALAVCATG